MLWAVRIPSAWLINRYGKRQLCGCLLPHQLYLRHALYACIFPDKEMEKYLCQAAAVTKQPDHP